VVIAQEVDDVSWYRVTVNGPVPPVQETWTLSEVLVLTGLEAKEPRVTDDGDAFTVTVDEVGDVALSGVEALSVTCISKLYVSPTNRELGEIEHVSVVPAVAPLPPLTAQTTADPEE
jgi:hypothetical protein